MNTSTGNADNMVKRIVIEMSSSNRGDDTAVDRIASILQQRIEERCGAVIVEGNADFVVRLGYDFTVEEQGFRIEDDPSGGVCIKGNGSLGLLYGVGKFLHRSIYTAEGLIPTTWRGTSIPRGPLRGIYFANHFFNWYHVAPEHEITRYIEDIALWGYNMLMLVFPIVNLFGWDDPEAVTAFDQIKSMFGAAKNLGLKVGFGVVPNQDFKHPNREFRAVPNPDPLQRRGNHGNNVCPSIPGAKDYLLAIAEGAAGKLNHVELDYLVLWPYDEGGCACETCAPWGANGYYWLSKEVTRTFRRYVPNLKVILSTWTFDTPWAGEWDGLAEKLAAGDDWIDLILADSHDDFPRYPLENGVPGGLPLINFPEISMWGLWPWGGYGANPLPRRFETLWKQVKDLVQGGYPYSEGLFDDINKVVVSQFYWDADKTAEESLREYISYEYSDQVVDEVLRLIDIIEQNHTLVAMQQEASIDDAVEAFAIAVKVNEVLSGYAQQSWRWRILYIRALLDRERYLKAKEDGWPWRSGKQWGMLLEGNKQAEEAMRELIQLYHAKETDDPVFPEHSWIRPPLRS